MERIVTFYLMRISTIESMRNLLSLVLLVILLGVTLPAKAQLRDHVQSQEAAARLYGTDGPMFSLNRLFSPEHFRMGHSYEMSFGSFGNQSSSLGMYTNSMMFQFNDKLAARVDLSFAHSPFGSSNVMGDKSNQGQFFLRNAEVAYRPSENVRLHLSVRQSPYGSYMNPYGHYGYGYGRHSAHSLFAGFGNQGDDLFWNDRLR